MGRAHLQICDRQVYQCANAVAQSRARVLVQGVRRIAKMSQVSDPRTHILEAVDALRDTNLIHSGGDHRQEI